jgi:hypothetical protein
MIKFFFDIQAGNTIGRSGKPRTVIGEVTIDVNSNDMISGMTPGWPASEEKMIRQELQNCADQIKRRLERGFPTALVKERMYGE